MKIVESLNSPIYFLMRIVYSKRYKIYYLQRAFSPIKLI